MAYLGHVILADGVAMDRDKIDVVTSWPQPRLVRSLHGFLGLVGYYRRFIQDYDAIATPHVSPQEGGLCVVTKGHRGVRRAQAGAFHCLGSSTP
jgi:hypothetical protein